MDRRLMPACNGKETGWHLASWGQRRSMRRRSERQSSAGFAGAESSPERRDCLCQREHPNFPAKAGRILDLYYFTVARTGRLRMTSS
jgi:hypothetical protein